MATEDRRPDSAGSQDVSPQIPSRGQSFWKKKRLKASALWQIYFIQQTQRNKDDIN